MKDNENIINIFIVDSNERTARIYADVCRMMKWVDVYRFSRWVDALKFASTNLPGTIIIACDRADNSDASEAINRLSYLASKPLIIAAGPSHDEELEKEMGTAGALSYLPTPINKDTLFYLVKNIVDIYRNNNKQKDSLCLQSSLLERKKQCYFKMVTVKGYHDVILMNKNIGALPIILKNTGNLAYIRLLSFLYDFFVKTFLEDKNFSAVIFVDINRIIVEFRLSDDIVLLMKSTVFYSIAEKYYFSDEYFAGFNMNFEGDCQTHEYVDNKVFSGLLGAETGLKFSDLFFESSDDEFIVKFNHIVAYYANYCPVFGCFSDFIAEKSSILNIKNKRNELSSFFYSIDMEIKNLSTFDIGGVVGRGQAENRLISAITKIMIEIYK